MNQSINEVYRKLVPVFKGPVLVFVAILLVVGLQDVVSQDSLADTIAPDAADRERLADGDAASAGAEIEDPPYTPKTVAELQKSLSPIQFKVTQNEETEPAFRNKYWDNKKEGVYRCIVCGQSLFSSETKYRSGTGWPSFYDPIDEDRIGKKVDFRLIYPRQEVHCSRCKAHLGHVFNDGPKDKSGKRYCLNSAALQFEASEDNDGKSKPKKSLPPKELAPKETAVADDESA